MAIFPSAKHWSPIKLASAEKNRVRLIDNRCINTALKINFLVLFFSSANSNLKTDAFFGPYSSSPRFIASVAFVIHRHRGRFIGTQKR